MANVKNTAKAQPKRAKVAGQWEWRKREELKPSPHNAKGHDKAQLAQVAASYHEFGWTIPILIDEANMILAGHGRWMMAGQEGIDEVPVIVARGWTAAQKRAYIIADNRLAELGKIDKKKLAFELEALSDMAFNATLTGFNKAQIKALTSAVKADPKTLVIEPIYQVLIECKDEKHQLDVIKKLSDLGIKCRSLIA